MSVKKTILTKLSFDDGSAVYTADFDTVLMEALRHKYEGVCYRSCMVTKITKILNVSNIVYSRSKQNASCTCSVQFEIIGLVVKNNLMLHNCVVKKIDKDGHIACKNNYASIYIKAPPGSKYLQTIQTGQTIVAITGGKKYKIFNEELSINALPFIPLYRDIVIYDMVVENPTGIVKKTYDAMLDEIEQNKKIDPLVYKFFIELLYPYKSDDVLSSLTEGKVTSIEHIMQMDEGSRLIISNPDSLPIDSPNIFVYSGIKKEDPLKSTDIQQDSNQNLITTENYENIMGYIIQLYIELMQNIRELCTTYSTMELIYDNSNLWDIYNSQRKN